MPCMHGWHVCPASLPSYDCTSCVALPREAPSARWLAAACLRTRRQGHRCNTQAPTDSCPVILCRLSSPARRPATECRLAPGPSPPAAPRRTRPRLQRRPTCRQRQQCRSRPRARRGMGCSCTPAKAPGVLLYAERAAPQVSARSRQGSGAAAPLCAERAMLRGGRGAQRTCCVACHGALTAAQRSTSQHSAACVLALGSVQLHALHAHTCAWTYAASRLKSICGSGSTAALEPCRPSLPRACLGLLWGRLAGLRCLEPASGCFGVVLPVRLHFVGSMQYSDAVPPLAAWGRLASAPALRALALALSP
jgi:hypothetical protein